MELLNLPIIVIEHIFDYLTYDDIAKCRLISRNFNELSMRMLNRGFMMIERRHACALRHVKQQLPRRESERRYHQLSRHCDILTSIETRLSMLNMTYSKYIDNGYCCFIPGKVLDEISRVLSVVDSAEAPPRAHEVLQELRDISSMAIEHFDDKISPAFRRNMQTHVERCQSPRAHHREYQPVDTTVERCQSPRADHSAVQAPQVLKQEVMYLRRRSLLNARLSLHLSTQAKRFHKKAIELRNFAWQQHRIIRDMTKRQRDQDATIAELKKRIEGCDIKISELTQAAGGKAIGEAGGSLPSTPPLRNFSSQINLDLSVMPIGNRASKREASPNMKPRRTNLRTPNKPVDPQVAMNKIHQLANEIRDLSQLRRCYEFKRTASDENSPSPSKKQKTE